MAEERRRRPRPTTVAGFLDQFPAVVLLNRISIPMLAVADDGMIVFANPACQVMLGAGKTSINGQPLNRFLHVPAAGASDSVAALREAAGEITTWQHARDEIVKAVVSAPLLMRAEDPILLVGLTDVTELLWTTGPDGHHGQA
jgi:nitrogen-specific signal transduction histidine kinase